MDFYMKIDEDLIENGKLELLEVLLYPRCYRFAENCKAMGREYYLDQAELASVLRVSRKTIRGYVKRLKEIGLFDRIGYTATKQVIYCVKDWESMKHDELLPTSELETFNGKYQAERERNRTQFQAHYDKKADEAAEEVSTSFKEYPTRATGSRTGACRASTYPTTATTRYKATAFFVYGTQTETICTQFNWLILEGRERTAFFALHTECTLQVNPKA